jgi:hypothetical protein
MGDLQQRDAPWNFGQFDKLTEKNPVSRKPEKISQKRGKPFTTNPMSNDIGNVNNH